MPTKSVSVPAEHHLLIDVGNSRVKWTWCHDLQQGIGPESAAVHTDSREQWLDHLSDTAEHPTSSIQISDVAGLDTVEMRRLQALFQTRPNRVQVRADCLNLVVAYPNPGNLGVDRWLAMMAAWQPQPRPVVVIDAGSAITVDLVSVRGRHLGGWIAPGFRALAEGLTRVAPRLPEVSVIAADTAPGNDTQPAILNARGAMVAGLIQQARDHLSRSCDHSAADVEQVISGGDGDWVAKLLPQHDRICLRPHLVLDGLRILLLNNAC